MTEKDWSSNFDKVELVFLTVTLAPSDLCCVCDCVCEIVCLCVYARPLCSSGHEGLKLWRTNSVCPELLIRHTQTSAAEHNHILTPRNGFIDYEVITHTHTHTVTVLNQWSIRSHTRRMSRFTTAIITTTHTQVYGSVSQRTPHIAHWESHFSINWIDLPVGSMCSLCEGVDCWDKQLSV